jgi:hypothetical protein
MASSQPIKLGDIWDSVAAIIEYQVVMHGQEHDELVVGEFRFDHSAGELHLYMIKYWVAPDRHSSLPVVD